MTRGLFFILFTLFAATGARADSAIDRQVLVRLAPGSPRAELERRIKGQASIEGSQGAMHVVRFERPPTKDELEKLKKIPGVIYVERDAPVGPDGPKPTKTRDCADCGKPKKPKDVTEKAADEIAKVTQSCSLAEACPGNGARKLWAQERVDADLMREELAKLSPPTTKIAVIDTGFDQAGNPAKQITLKKGHDKAGDPAEDKEGHGTMVAGLIAGRDGVGVAPEAELSVYRFTAGESPEGEPESEAWMKLAVERACADGSEVIVLSWSLSGDELAIREDEEKDKAFLKSLAARGCLVVKSSGNAGSRYAREHMDADDAYLRIEAGRMHGGVSKVSTLGELVAPGEGVFTLESSQLREGAKAKGGAKCGEAPGRFVNGTSFAAPIAGGIAAQVISVLKRNPSYAKLQGPERIRLVNRVLAASRRGGFVNGLRAVTIADRWRSSGAAAIPSAKDLLALLDHPFDAACSRTKPACLAQRDCAKRKDCVKAGRRALAVCSKVPEERVDDLLQTTQQSGELELAAAIALSDGDAQAKSRLERALKAKEAKAYWDDFAHEGTVYPDQGIHRKLDYAAFLKERASFPNPLDELLERARGQLLLRVRFGEVDEHKRALIESLARNRLITPELADGVVTKLPSDLAYDFIVKAAKQSPAIPGLGNILKAAVAGPDADGLVLSAVSAAIRSADGHVLGAASIVDSVLSHKAVNSFVLNETLYALGSAPGLKTDFARLFGRIARHPSFKSDSVDSALSSLERARGSVADGEVRKALDALAASKHPDRSQREKLAKLRAQLKAK